MLSTRCSHGHKTAATVCVSPDLEGQWSVEEERDVSSSMSLLKSKEVFPKGPNQVSSVPLSLQCFIGQCLSYTSHWQGHRISRINLVKHRAMWRRTAYLDRMGFI